MDLEKYTHNANIQLLTFITEYNDTHFIYDIKSATWIILNYLSLTDNNYFFTILNQLLFVLVNNVWKHNIQWKHCNNSIIDLNSPWVLVKKNSSNLIYCSIIIAAKKIGLLSYVKQQFKQYPNFMLCIQPHNVLVSLNQGLYFHKPCYFFSNVFMSYKITNVIPYQDKVQIFFKHCKFQKYFNKMKHLYNRCMFSILFDVKLDNKY